MVAWSSGLYFKDVFAGLNLNGCDEELLQLNINSKCVYNYDNMDTVLSNQIINLKPISIHCFLLKKISVLFNSPCVM